MIDLAILRESPELVKASQKSRGESVELVDLVLDLDNQRRAANLAFDTMRNEQRVVGKTIAKATGEEKAGLLAKAGELAAEVKTAEAKANALDVQFKNEYLKLSNLVEAQAPIGGEDDFVVIEHVGTPRTFDFKVRDHLELGEMLGAIDTERGAKVSGARFFYLKGIGARLEFALLNLAMSQALENGFIPMITPVLVKPESMEGTGYLGVHGDEIYHLNDDDLYLVGTSEVPLAAYHRDEILDAATLPLRYVGFSSCFRREAGSYGKDTRGIIRVHQFDKVEMFSFCPTALSQQEHQNFLNWEKQFINSLELPFRVIDTASGDLGSSAARKFDCEAWLPSQNAYREITSTSNTTQYQARRLNIRTKGSDGNEHVAMLNGTLCAMPRMIVAILENHQQSDGSVVIPPSLRPYLGGSELIEPGGTLS